jgi:WD40 repeat protein
LVREHLSLSLCLSTQSVTQVTHSLTRSLTHTHTQNRIQCVQFSPDAETLAVGSRDKTVYFYNIKDEYGLQATFTGHKAGVTRIDFSECSQYVRSNSSDYNLLFSNVLDGKAISQSSTMRDTTWATQDCILSWNTKGLHNNMTARSVLATDVSKSSELLVSADTFGNVQLRHYPCLSSKKQFKNYKGHSSEVRNVKFSMSDTYIVSCGANDRCVFQWVLEKNEILESKRGVVMGSDTLASYGDLNMETKLYEEETKEEEEEEEERSKTSSKSKSAWKGSIVEPSPSEKTRSDETAPNEVQVTLEHVYGYRSRDCRSNMFYNASDNLVYPAGSIGVVYDKRVHKQCFYRGHRGADITALTMDSRRCYVASAQHGDAKRAAEIHIWDSQSCAPISVCAPFHRGSVVALAFSHCSHKLVSLGVHGRMALWCSTSGLWNDIERRASANTPNTASSRVLFVQFCSHLRSTEFEIATGGLGHVTFWNSKLEPQKAVYCKNPIAPMLCGAILSNHLVCGSFTGKIYKFHPGTRQCVRVVDAHNGSVNSMFSIPDGSCLVSGAKCGSVIVWNADLSVRAKYDLLRIPESIVPILPEVRSVCMNEFGVVIAGTSSSDVYQLFGQNKSSQLLQAHFEGELRGLSAHPVDSKLFATSGDDKTVRIWNSSTKKLITMQKLDMPSRACTFSNCGSRIVCGFGAKSDTGGTTKNGAYVVFESKDMTLVHEDRPSRVAITALRYSTSGDHIAIVSDKKIYITSSLDFQTRAVVSNHNSAVTHFDFSADSKHLRTNTAQNELKFFNSSDGKEIKSASSLKDCEWSSTTCPLVWSTQGLHGVTSSSERRKVTCVDRFETLLASGDESGEIRLHRFPCVNDKAESICLLGHGSEVSSLKFSSDGTMLYSVGARDRVICQWCVSGVNTSSQSESSSKEEDFSSSKEADMPIGVG